jgi:hypothetical protein
MLVYQGAVGCKVATTLVNGILNKQLFGVRNLKTIRPFENYSPSAS